MYFIYKHLIDKKEEKDNVKSGNELNFSSKKELHSPHNGETDTMYNIYKRGLNRESRNKYYKKDSTVFKN